MTISTSKQIAQKLFITTTALLMMVNLAHAQITRAWNKASGGIYDLDANWTPTGEPESFDTARFNVLLPGEIPISFFQNEAASGLQIDNGDIVLEGAGISGIGPRHFDVEVATVSDNSQLTLRRNAQNRGFHLTVADRLDVNEELSITQGTMLSTLGSDVVQGPDEDSIATVNVIGESTDGEISRWTANDVKVGGLNGNGQINIEAGAAADFGSVDLGFQGSNAAILVRGTSPIGTPASLHVSGNMGIGTTGAGLLEVREGGQVSAGNVALASFGSTAVGDLVVDGTDSAGNPSRFETGTLLAQRAGVFVRFGGQLDTTEAFLRTGRSVILGSGTSWTNEGQLRIGALSGDFVLDVKNGAEVSTGVTSIATQPGGTAGILVSGTTPGETAKMTVTGDLFIGGDSDEAGGEGNLEITGHAIVEATGTIKIWDEGLVTMGPSSQLIADRIENTLGGEFVFEQGTLQTNRFEGELVNQGGTIEPGGAGAGLMFIVGDYSQQVDASMSIDIGGTNAGVDHDLINLSGLAALDGELNVNLINGFMPNPGDEITTLVTSNLLGLFDNVLNGQRLSTEDGRGSFTVNYGVGSAFAENRVVLSDFQASTSVPGDFDFDGDVDGRDFLSWQRNGGSAGELATWQANFGTSPSPLQASTAVPEPASFLLFTLGVLSIVSGRQQGG